MSKPETGNAANEGRDRALVAASPVAMFTVAVVDGSITSVNPAFERLTDVAAARWIGQPLTALAHPEAIAELISRLHQATLGIRPEVFELRLHTPSDTFVLAELELVPELAEGQVRRILGFALDKTEHRTVSRDLRAAKEAAEVSSQAKSEFLANMSDEFRTPLNAIIGLSGLMIDLPLEEKVKGFAKTVRTSGQTLLARINGILDFSRMESGELELASQPFDLGACVTSAIELVGVASAEKGLKLTAEVPQSCPAWLYGDSKRVRQVLVNLLTNAVQFTERGSVALTVDAEPVLAQDEYEVTFTVRDTGIGIPARKLERIFDAFVQVDTSASRCGTGLGLSTCHRLSKLMGGTLHVDSTVGEGSTFRFVLAARSAGAQMTSVERRGVDPELAKKLPLTILVAEDHPTNQEIARLLLEKMGYHPDIVADGGEALDALEHRTYDVVLMDVHMPVLDGLEASREIRQKWGVEKPRIVAMTTSTLPGDQERYRQAGMDDFIGKPIFEEELEEVLRLVGGGEQPNS
jgi:PAS domain S-box-containing protein